MVPEASLDISRRQFLAAGGLTVAAACFAPSYLMAETEGIVVGAFKEAATAKVTVQNLRRNISVLLGPGGNIAVLTGPDGKLLVDAEIITARPHVSEALASINADPIKQLINTHWHFDHTGGNEWVHEAGASILAHENTRKHLSQATRVEGNFRYTFPAAPAGAIPSAVFKDEHTLHANNTTLMLKHYQPAHTDSDISVHFVEADRLARSVRHFLEVLDTLNHLGIEFVSFRENLDTGGPLGRAVIVIVSPVAELERNLIIERVRAGLRRARLEGRTLGRKPIEIDRASLLRDRTRGLSLAQLAKSYKISSTSVARALKQSEAVVPKTSLPALESPQCAILTTGGT
jgi:hypothetical protein